MTYLQLLYNLALLIADYGYRVGAWGDFEGRHRLDKLEAAYRERLAKDALALNEPVEIEEADA